NRGRWDFLGIHFLECYEERALERILRPFIGEVSAHRFVKPHDPHIESSHWSNADELLVRCRQLAAEQPDGSFPTEEWLRKRGRGRAGRGPAYNTISVYIKTWLGGMRHLRELIGQPENSTTRWDRGMALRELAAWFGIYGKSPGAVRRAVKRGKAKVEASE